MGDVARAAVDVLGNPTIARATRRITGRRLRILAYHGVPDPNRFRAQMVHLATDYHPVSGSQVRIALHGGGPLPDGAVWVTFDDGCPDVVENGQSILEELSIPATLFVVASLIDSHEPFWWTVVEAAADQGLTADRALLTTLKRVPDSQRRATVADLAARLSGTTGPVLARNLTTADLRQWVQAGHEVGNHSWDHPCLDRCPDDEQVRQVTLAHDRLTEMLGTSPVVFAYPNGNWSAAVHAELQRRRYAVGLLFDHRLANLRGDRLRLSRLRVDASADAARFRSIVSGGHSGLFAAQASATHVIKRLARRPRHEAAG